MAGGGMQMLLMIILLVALFYFMLIRPQKKQQQKHQDMMSALKPGDEVVTIGRLHGVVDEVNNENRTVVLNCEGIYLTFDLSAIASVNKPKVAPAATTEAPKEVETTEATTVEETPVADEAKTDDTTTETEEK